MSDAQNAHRIRRLPHGLIPDVGVLVFTGCTGSGKTVAMIDVMYQKRHYFKQVIVMSGSQETCEQFGKHVPPVCIFDSFDERRLEQIYMKQEADLARGCQKPILIILDDLMYLHQALQKSVILSKIFMNGRHAGILLFISMQYCKCLGPGLRGQVRVAFIGADKSPERRKKIYEAFNTVFHTVGDFDSCMRACTLNYEMMVLPTTNVSSDAVEDNVFWWKARQHKQFKMCKDGPLWAINKALYDPNYFINNMSNCAGAATVGGGAARGKGKQCGKYIPISKTKKRGRSPSLTSSQGPSSSSSETSRVSKRPHRA